MKPVAREFMYYKNKPVLVLKPTVRDNKNRFMIKLEDLWKYSDTHNEHFELFFKNRMLQICKTFDIAVPKSEKAFVNLMSTISQVVMDGIDELVKKPPYRPGIDDPEAVIDKPQKNVLSELEARGTLV